MSGDIAAAAAWAGPAPEHPVLGAIAGARTALDEADAAGLLSLGAPETRAALIDAYRLLAQAGALLARLTAHGEVLDVGAQNGSPSTAVWLSCATRMTRPQARRTQRIGDAVADGSARPLLAAGHRAGDVDTDQAEAIVAALDDLPDGLDPHISAEAERVLVGYAADFDAHALRRLGKRVLHVVAPEVGEAHEAALLEREEREAAASARLTLASDGRGVMRGRIALPELAGRMLLKVLDAYVPPGEAATPQARGQSMIGLVEGLRDADLPTVGGGGATVVVTMTLDSLLGGLASASLDVGGSISAAEARRIACGAGLVPVVLDGASRPLDLGRTQRLHNRHQRIAIAARDRGCTAEGCDRPPHQCAVHHDVPWSHGGATSVTAGRLLCGHHHRRVHDPAYRTERLGTGKLRFVRRT